MYNFLIKNVENKYDFQELMKVFLQPEEFQLYTEQEYAGTIANNSEIQERLSLDIINEKFSNDKNEIKREIFNKLVKLTGIVPKWGILTGVRPVKLTAEIVDKYGFTNMPSILSDVYLVSEEKINLLVETYEYQKQKCAYPKKNSVGLYIGIPFCPTRCSYCSFTSNQVGNDEIQRYLDTLEKEILYIGTRMKELGIWVESVYIGGGTPTTLSDKQLYRLLTFIMESIDLSKCVEFTVEAGRPDTIDDSKLKVLHQLGIDRISINPQTMNAKTLQLIGRSHSPEDINQAFQMAEENEIHIINADLIAGLPEETEEDFLRTISDVLSHQPQNITVHTLAVKRASKLVEQDKHFHYKQGKIVEHMLEIASLELKRNGYRPYYLYRQKHMAGSFENVGWCKGDTPCIYNIRIMEERQSILALGAGGISKVYFEEENRLERIPNVSNYQIYIERINEMIERKEENFFGKINNNYKEVEEC